MILFVSLAAAQDPTSTVAADGTVEVRCTIDATPEQVRASLADPVAAGKLSPDTLSVVSTMKGNCAELDLKVKGIVSPLQLTALRCPTKTGWKYSLVKSETVTRFDAEWTLVPDGDRTEVVYRLRSDVSLPVPDSFVRRSVLASARDTITALIRKVTRH